MSPSSTDNSHPELKEEEFIPSNLSTSALENKLRQLREESNQLNQELPKKTRQFPVGTKSTPHWQQSQYASTRFAFPLIEKWKSAALESILMIPYRTLTINNATAIHLACLGAIVELSSAP
jgi:hypothetical protein